MLKTVKAEIKRAAAQRDHVVECGRALMYRFCYRDTKMEIQGLTNAQNTHYQHGVPPSSDLSSPGRTGDVSDQLLHENDNGNGVDSVTDGNNNKQASSSLLLLPQNGSGASLQDKRSDSTPSPGVQDEHVGLCNLNVLKEKEYVDLELPVWGSTPADFVKLKYGEEESEDTVLQMAVPLFDSDEEGYTAECQQSQGHTASEQKDKCSETGDSTNGSAEAENSKDIYVVFNLLQERLIGQCEKDVNKRVDSDESILRDATHSSDLQRSPDLRVSQKRARKIKCKSKPSRSVGVTGGGHDAEIRTMSSEGSSANKMSGMMTCSMESMEHQESDDRIKCQSKGLIQCGTYNPDIPVRNSSECGNEIVNIASNSNNDALGNVPPETFSGTIMINNQSIIVTIENGVLTLAAPPENYTYKEDGVVSLKEQLGVKENEDIVLLNYESGTKSVGKLAEHERPVSDSEDLTLTHDCSLPVLGSSLEPSIKHEGSPCDRKTHKDQTEDEQHPATTAKKPGTGSFHCSQPGCTCAFDTRQKLKMHLVLHTEDQRPFKCTVEGCGWSFTTSYKLKRHLQSHDKQRPYTCEFENCGRRFTTVYNLKAHLRVHVQEDAFPCEMCGERFHTATRLANHQRTHFEPERPHKCEFPGCEKAFITFSALFSHNRTHFRETSQFICTYPGCDKCYDKACRLKIHLRSHTGERPFVCDFESCGWTFTSMSKLLRHKRKHDDDRRFTCPKEGCGKSFTRAEHLKGHSITHLGTKPFECPVEGCNAKFSARSSLYIHSKKHRQDGVCLRSRCPVAGCTKHFSSRSSLKSHMVKHHNLSPEVLNQFENTATLTPSCELTSAAQTATVPGSVATELSSLDLSCLLTSVSSGTSTVPTGPSPQSGPTSYTMDMALVSSGILTIDTASVGSALGAAKPVDPLILAAGGDISAHVLDAGGGGGVLQQAALQLDDVQTVNPEALGALTALAIQSTSVTEQLQALSSSSALTAESPSSTLTPSLTSSIAPSLAPPLVSSLVPSLVSSAVPELLSPQVKVDIVGNEVPVGPLLSGVEVLSQSENKAMSQFVFPSHSASYSGQKEAELPTVNACPFMESSGSARTDYRAIQLAKRKKQKGPVASTSTSGGTPRKTKGVKNSSAGAVVASTSARFGEGSTSTTAGFTIRDPVTGAQYVQIQLLQDDPAADGDLAFQLTSQTSSAHSQLTVDLPVNILQEPSAMADDDNGSDNSQFTGSTINLQDLE